VLYAFMPMPLSGVTGVAMDCTGRAVHEVHPLAFSGPRRLVKKIFSTVSRRFILRQLLVGIGTYSG